MIKKRYRQLMLQTHPDGEAWERESYAYSAPEINQAYAFLARRCSKCKGGSKDGPRGGGRNRDDGSEQETGRQGNGPREKQHEWSAWDAPLNENAFCEREILHNVEDEDGTVLGNFCVARGKFLWTVQEDFSLFLRSVYRCCQTLLDRIDEERGREVPSGERQRVLTELYYLMAQQFIDATALLEQMAAEKTNTGKMSEAVRPKEDRPETMRPEEERAETMRPDGERTDGGIPGVSDAKKDSGRIFYLPAMLECAVGAPVLQPGEVLYPAGVKRHRLYLKDRTGRNLGYLSFGDDRLYYVVIPFFEQKRVRIRIRAAEKMKGKHSKTAFGTVMDRYQRLHLWLKLEERQNGGVPESLNLQVERLLERYGKHWT